MKFFKTIKFRLTLWYLGVIVVLLLVFGSIAYIMLSNDINSDVDEVLASRATAIKDRLEKGEADIANERLEGQLNETIMVYSSSGVLLKKYGMGIEFAGADSFAKDAYGRQYVYTTSVTAGIPVRFYATAVNTDGGDRSVIIVGRAINWVDNALESMREMLGLAGLIVIVLAGAGGLLLASRALKPVDDIISTAQDIESSDLSRRINMHSEDELGRLASTLNRMIERLEASFNHQRQFTADISHELRTPLAVIAAESTLALNKERTPLEYRKSLEIVSQESAYMSSLIDKVLYFARSNAVKEQLNFADINLCALIAELSSDVRVLANEKDILYEVAVPEDIIVKGDKLKLKQLFLSLLENAASYTPKGGRISVNFSKTEDRAQIDICDTGVGIPAEHLPHIFERYYRARQARSGTEGGIGLGLAIAKSIVEIHDGSIEVESEVGKGSIFRVMLPLANIGV